jgi:hypothetical protein
MYIESLNEQVINTNQLGYNSDNQNCRFAGENDNCGY